MPNRHFDVILLFVLVIARVRIDTLADLVLPNRHDDVRRLVSGWWPSNSLDLLADWLSDPVTLTLVALAMTGLLLYVLVDAVRDLIGEGRTFWLKLCLIYLIIMILVGGKTGLLIGLRHITEPAAYTHDGGVIQTEITIDYFLSGKSPYIEDYLDTPMASWGIEFRTALHHYPYLPWTFIFSAPFYLLSHAVLGWYDQRFIYLILFGLTLVLSQSLARTRPNKLLVVMFMGLNPILASDVIFGQNDSFILFWIVLGVWLLRRAEDHPDTEPTLDGGTWQDRIRKLFQSTQFRAQIALGLACASKPTAWFIAPFWGLYLVRREWGTRFFPPIRQWPSLFGLILTRAWPVIAVVILVVGPWFVWSPDAMIDDVWRWSSGTAERPYQIRGWGLSHFVLAFQGVTDRLDYWPFWMTEIAIASPLLVLALLRQVHRNTLGMMLYGYVTLLLGFFFSSRFLNENYLGYLAAFLILALLIDDQRETVEDR